MGIKLIHSRPYTPQGRGKIERFFGTVESQFLSEISVVNDTDAGQQTDHTGSAVGSLDELNALFSSWVHVVYHRTTHSTTAMTPLARWDHGWEHHNVGPDRRSPEVIAEAFRWSTIRKVSKTATVSLHGNTYQVQEELAGRKVELIYDPFDLAEPMTVISADGFPAGQAVIQEIRRHVAPKAHNAAKDADTAAVNAASGIDYLRLIQDQHQEFMTGAPISFDTINTTNAAAADDSDAGSATPDPSGGH